MDRPDAGLCERCNFRRLQKGARGSHFLRCGRANGSPDYLRYPPLPVVECGGFEEVTNPAGSEPRRNIRARMHTEMKAEDQEE